MNYDHPTEVNTAPEDFNGKMCETGKDSCLAVAGHRQDFPPANTLSYYVQSVPVTTGAVAKVNPIVKNFKRPVTFGQM